MKYGKSILGPADQPRGVNVKTFTPGTVSHGTTERYREGGGTMVQNPDEQRLLDGQLRAVADRAKARRRERRKRQVTTVVTAAAIGTSATAGALSLSPNDPPAPAPFNTEIEHFDANGNLTYVPESELTDFRQVKITRKINTLDEAITKLNKAATPALVQELESVVAQKSHINGPAEFIQPGTMLSVPVVPGAQPKPQQAPQHQ